MGNVPSHEAPRRTSKAPHKLSKPKTGNFTTAGLLSPNGFPNSSQRFSDSRLSASLPFPPPPASSPIALPHSETGEATVEQKPARRASLAPPTPAKERRLSLFRSKSSQGEVERRNQRRNTVIGTSTPAAEKHIARANSMTCDYRPAHHYGRQPAENWPLAGSRASWTYDLNSYEAKRLLHLVDERTALEQAAATIPEGEGEAVSETTWKSSHPTQPQSTPISRANSDLSLYTPVRRRSIIQTPGVATRTGNGPGSTRPSFRYSHPPTPSLSRQASFESNGGRILSMPPPPRSSDVESMPRVVTPCDGDYKTIGAFKLGSLRIVNGSPILSPEIARSRKSEESKQSSPDAARDYFSETRGGELRGVTGETEDKLQGGKPLPSIEIARPAARELSSTASSFSKLDDGGGGPTGASSTASEIRGEYLAEIQFSPFSLDGGSPTRAELQTTSKHTAIEDKLFEAEDDQQPEYPPVEVLDVRLDPSAKSLPPRPVADPAQRTRGSVARSDSGFVSSPISESSASQKTLAKADSGYSSSVSLRSFRVDQKTAVADARGRTAAADKHRSAAGGDPAHTHDLNLPSATAMENEKTPQPPNREAPPPPPKDQLLASPTRAAKPVLETEEPVTRSKNHIGLLATPSLVRKSLREPPSPINSTRTGDIAPESPLSVPLTPASAASDVSASALSIGSGGSHKPGKLQRLLSFNGSGISKTRLTVHITHAIDKAVPSVPQHVEAKLHEHTGLFPITTKRLALKTQLSKDTLRTIFSVGSVDAPKDESQQVPPSFGDAESTMPGEVNDTHMHNLQSMSSTVAHTAASVIPTRKQIARKPVPSRQQSGSEKQEIQSLVQSESVLPVEAELATYISVNHSLGNNAYDAALHAMADNRDAYVASQPAPARTMSMTTQFERGWDMRTYSLRGQASFPDEAPMWPPRLQAPTQQAPPARKDKTPPPVSLSTRKQVPLRVPPPLRPQSTPPRTPSLSRKASRESIHSYPASNQPVQQPSNDNDSSLPPPIPPLNPRRSLELRHSQIGLASQYRTPSWEVQTDHDPLASRRSSAEQIRSNSLSSSHGGPIQRSTSVQPYSIHPNLPPLRHRSSYDGYSHIQGTARYPAHLPPNFGPKQQHQDPWSDMQFSLHVQQSNQHGNYPPYVPRGHYRNRSTGSYNGQPGQDGHPPYRVLHSYNSPAYRNVPIWG
ncbi:Proteophosphoglycan PPG4 [Pleurostoma richardsiae]|uniref:Proteophosphoglycan PPG4 n=1 Tax=Pleurostoma richardsiae TaxID=41990 RepID=A0AA38S3D6_9PEZI|nr:Proteophosphoglycan PPG4 [Pleurostoma richardsiae]